MTFDVTRRNVLMGFAAAAASVGVSPAAASPAVDDRRLRNRLELWANFAQRTTNLVARVSTTRHSAYFREPLAVTGQLLFRVPGPVVFRDDGLAGSTTWIDRERLEILPNQAREVAVPNRLGRQNPAASWLADRLFFLFAPGDGEQLMADSRVQVPRHGYKLSFSPPRSSEIRRLVRSVIVELDGTAGAVVEIQIDEAQGDRVRMQLSDHRRNLPAEDIAAMFAEVEALRG